MRKAIVTIVVGDLVQAFWQRYSRPTWQKYAERHGYDLVVIDKLMDTSLRARARSVAWQKLLIANDDRLGRYETVVWLDADIVINHHLAPCIAEGMRKDRIGICEETKFPPDPLFSEMSRQCKELILASSAKRGIPYPLDPHRRYGFSEPAKLSFNTGVMVLRPALHRRLLERVYTEFEDKGPDTLYEQVPLSHSIVESGLYEVLDPKFNVHFSKLAAGLGMLVTSRPLADGRIGLIAALLNVSYFLHFAGVWAVLMNDLALLDLDSNPMRVRLQSQSRS
jgi:hypothetical protein